MRFRGKVANAISETDVDLSSYGKNEEFPHLRRRGEFFKSGRNDLGEVNFLKKRNKMGKSVIHCRVRYLLYFGKSDRELKRDGGCNSISDSGLGRGGELLSECISSLEI